MFHFYFIILVKLILLFPFILQQPLAKLVCGVHKPNRQTILPPDKVSLFFSTLPLRKMRNLGGKFGMEVAERLGCGTMGDLAKFSLKELQRRYDDKNG